MRLWSLHPSYLDAKGLVALWREALLAQNVLAGKTKGYRHHPQLHRFLEQKNPLACLGWYLSEVAKEAKRRGYQFNEHKILESTKPRKPISVTRGQMQYEFQHLLRKLMARDPERYALLKNTKRIKTHSLFKTVPGKIEDWERT